MSNQATMANKDAILSTNEVSKSTCQVQTKLVPAETEEPEPDPIKNSSKRRKTEKSASTKVKAQNQKKPSRKSSDINVGNGVNEQQKSCHQCHRNERDRVVECKKCRSKKFCVTCITKWYPNTPEEEFVKACPFCRNNCNCKACLRGYSPKGYSCSKPDKIRYSKHIIQKVLPFVRKLNEDQLMEKFTEAKVKGLSLSELQLQDAECEVDDDIYCDNCGAYLFDLYRSCACGYDLCLECCQDLRDKGMKCGWKSCIDGSIPCPPIPIGGCNEGILELKRIMPLDWVVNTLEKAQRMHKINANNEIHIRETTIQENSNTSCLYSTSAKDIQPRDMQHFQLHWSKGEPVIVNDVLSTSLGLSWEPMVLWRAFRDITKNSNRSHACEVDAIDCLNWSKVSVDLYKFFRGYSEGQFERKGLPVILKLEDWQPSSCLYGEFSRHFVEFIGCLPFKDYTHPQNGYMNLAVKLLDLSLKPDMGPRMDIAYGNSVTKLHYDKSDTVNVLTHTKSPIPKSTKLNDTKTVKPNHGDEGEALVCDDEGAVWDIFRRQDIPKLENYLRNHSTDLMHPEVEKIAHLIHDRIFYLNMEHKRKLKEEVGIEPWTFRQKLGDAIFIPAGCPYQVRNLKSCTKVELNFVSPESLGECIRLQQELRVLPSNHKAKQNKLNIGKMMLYALDHAVMDLSGVIDSNEPIDDDDAEFVKKVPPATSNDNFNHTNGWVNDTESSSSNESLALNTNHTVVDHEPSRTLTPETTENPHETEGLWRGNAVGPEAKKLLDAIDLQYPNTFQGVQISAKAMWISILNEFHVIIKGFLETSVDSLAKERLTGLREDLKEFERFGFDLSWAHKRIDMVEGLKFGNEPLHQELMALEESLGPLKERLGGRWKQYVEAHEMLKVAQLEYDNATDARNKKAREVIQKFGAEYGQVLKGHLGFGMLQGY